MKRESKVAWLTESPFDERVQCALRSGNVIWLEDILDAVGGGGGCVDFDGKFSANHRRSNYTIFQYSVVLQRSDGSVAVFNRGGTEASQKRLHQGKTPFLSISIPVPPDQGTRQLLQSRIAVGARRSLGATEPLGVVYSPSASGGASFLIALFRHWFPDNLILHGRYRDSPDEFTQWIPPENLDATLRFSGKVTQMAAKVVRCNSALPIDEGSGGLIYSPDSAIQTRMRADTRVGSGEYSYSRNVFISHAAEDSFAAYCLFNLLLDESNGRVYPTVDLKDTKDGESLQAIDRLIAACDCFLLIISPTLTRKSQDKKNEGEFDWVQYEVEMAKKLGKPILGFKTGASQSPPYFPDDIVANDKSLYVNWEQEISNLIDRIESCAL